MVAKCVGAYNVEVLRFTAVDSCGRPIYGPCSTNVIDCFETLEINPDIEDGEEIAPVNANGRQCFFVPASKLDRGFEVVANITKKYMSLYTKLNPNWLQTIDELGNLTGIQHIPEVSQTSGVAIEGWELVAGSDACTPGSAGAWNYFLLPYVVNWSRGDLELGNQVHTEEWNAHTLGGNRWGVGPYNIRENASTGTDGPLIAALDTRSHWYDEVVTLAPPEATCECIPLSNPEGPPAAITQCTAESMTVGVTATSGRPMQIEWGDGSAPAVLTTAVQLTHLYATPNRYIITVRFTDAAMEESFLVVTVPCP